MSRDRLRVTALIAVFVVLFAIWYWLDTLGSTAPTHPLMNITPVPTLSP